MPFGFSKDFVNYPWRYLDQVGQKHFSELHLTLHDRLKNGPTCAYVLISGTHGYVSFADVIELRILRWAITLDDLSGPDVITRILDESQGEARSRGKPEDALLLALKMEERGMNQRVQGMKLWKLERAKTTQNQLLPIISGRIMALLTP